MARGLCLVAIDYALMGVNKELGKSAALEPERRIWLWVCRLSALAAAAALWTWPAAFFHFRDSELSISGLALVPATFPYALALLWLRKNSPSRGGLQLAAGAAITTLIFVAASFVRASKHVWAPLLPSAIAGFPQLALLIAAIQSHRPLARDGDYGLNFLSRTMLAVCFSGICFVVALFFSGALR